MSEKSNTSGGLGFFGLLAIVFITLKLTRFIDWNWWWVLSPLWGLAALWLIVVGIIIIVELIRQ